MANQQQNEHQPPFSISQENPFQLQQLAARSSQSLPSIIENTTETSSSDSILLSDIQKEFNRISHLNHDQTSPSLYSTDLSSLTNSDRHSSIPYMDSSSLEDQELSERKHSLTSINRKISLSETDLLASIHRNVTKQISDHDTTDDILFLEWDKERNLFQDYINSLRKEIRVLLQERLEYQTQKRTENKHISDDQMKIDLLQKSLEEKNFVVEQLQTEYELTKDKNINLIRKISLVQCDAKSHVGIIDELKQKIEDLTVDLQNHILIKRRLEISINNIETDCKIIDAERIRLTSDVKENQHKKQDLEKLLQKANVQIAEQGSTIEMLRSENVQVRSQLSTIQRRMFQEKQQIMDYLRQIENDLIEKEQIKQREASLRQDYEQLQITNKQDRKEIEHLKNSINQDQQKIQGLQQECSQLLKTIHTQNEQKIQLESQLDTFKSGIKPIDQLIPLVEDPHHTIQTPVQSTSELHDQLRQDLENITAQCKQLDEANQAWQQYQQNQLLILHDRFRLSNNDNLSFDDLVQQIETRLNNLQNECDTLANRVIELQALPTTDNESDDKLRQNLAVLTTQCAQLDEANRAWQQFQQVQLDNFRNKLQNSLPIENTFSFDDIASLIIDHINQLANERDTTQKLNDRLHTESTKDIDTIDEQLDKRSVDFDPKQDAHLEPPTFHSAKRADVTPFEEVPMHNLTVVQSAPAPINEHDEEVRQLRENLATLTIQCAQLDEANRAWQQYQQTQSQHNLSLDDNISFDQIGKEREEFTQRYQALEKTNDHLRLESTTNLETINELNQQLLAMKEELEKRTVDRDHHQQPSAVPKLTSDEIPLDILRNQLSDCLSLDYNASFEQIADKIKKERQEFNQRYEALEKANHDLRLDFDNNMETIRQSYLNAVNELNQELLAMKEQYEQLDAEKQFLNNQLENRSDQERVTQTIESSSPDVNLIDQQTEQSQLQTNRIWSDLRNILPVLTETSLGEIISYINNFLKEKEDILTKDLEHVNQQLINVYNQCEQLQEHNKELLLEKQTLNGHSSIDDDQLRQDYILLQNQCTQLDIANRAWQLFYDNQMDLLRNKFKDYLDFDNNDSFDQIIELIATELKQQNQLKDNVPSDSNAIIDSLKKQLENYQYDESILAQNLEQLNPKLLDVYKQCEEFRELNAQLILSKQQVDKQLEEREKQVQEFELLINKSNQHIHSPSEGITADNVHQEQEKEIHQLRTDLAALTTRCAQLDEANCAWQQYQQTQLQHNLPLDDNISLDQLPQPILDQIVKEREEFTQRYQALEKSNDHLRLESTTNLETINELNQQLLAMKKELEERTVDLNHQQQLNDVPKLTSDEIPLEVTHPNDEENQSSQQKVLDILRNQLSDCLSLDYNAPFEQIVDEIKKERQEFNKRYEALEKADHDLRLESDDNMKSIRESYLNTMKELNQELFDVKEQCKEFDRINKQLLIENEIFTNQLNDRSIVVDHHSPVEQQTSAKPNELHLRSTTPLNYNKLKTMPFIFENHSTQINTIDEESQTESVHQLWPTSDEETPREDNDGLNDYINGISSLSSIDVSNKLNKECEKILSKQNLKLTSFPNLDVNQLSLIALYSLYNQHLTDEAKQLYNETVVRVLKEEYELLNNEKNDLIEQLNTLQEKSDELLQLERLHSKQIMKDLNEENETLQQQLNNHNEKLVENTFEQEYNQLKLDFNALVKEHELLKDYNAQIYQEKLQENDSIEIKSFHDVDIQCSLQPISIDSSTIQTSSKEIEQRNDQNPIKQTIDNETQTDGQQQDKLVQVNNKLKRALQTIKDKINRIAIDQPELFPNSSDDTIVRLDHLISVIERQATQIDLSKTKPILSTRTLSEKEDDQSEPLIISSSRTNQTIDNETQTEDPQPDRLVQVNNKLKRALQTIKEKVHRIVVERPELFLNSSDDTIERLDYLISAIENQAAQIEILQTESNHAQQEINKLRNQLTAEASLFEDHEKQVDQLQQMEDERSLLEECLNEVKLELRKTLDDHALTMNKYQSLAEERDTLVQEHSLQSKEYEHEIQQLREEVAQLRQLSSEDDLKPLKEMIEQQTEELRDLTEKYLSQVELQDELNRQKKEIEERFNERENQIDNLMQERSRFLDEIEKNAASVIQTTDSDTQTDDHQHEKLVQVNNKLKRVLQGFKEKIHRIATERPELFDGIDEEANTRFDRLISTVENQATQIDILQAKCDKVEEQLRNEMKQLQSSLETCQKELDNERQIKMEQLVSSAPLSSPPDHTSFTTVEDYQKQIEQLQQNLSENDTERTSLRERLNEVEGELRKTLDDHESLVEQQALHSTQSQHEIQHLKEKLVALKHVEVQTNEEIKALHEQLEQQSDQVKDLNEKNTTLSSQLESQVELNNQKKEMEEQLNERENQLTSLMKERAGQLEQIEKNTSSPIDSDTQTDDDQHEKLVHLNDELKHALQTFKDKIHRVVVERPNLFNGIGEETNERLDHLISTVGNQTTQIDVLLAEHDRVEKQVQSEMKELQSSLEACQYELDNERRMKTEQLVSASASEHISSSVIQDCQKQIDQLQQNLSENDAERMLLREGLNDVGLELRKTLDDHTSIMTKNESLEQERDALIHQQTLRSIESEREIAELREELTKLKQSPEYQHVEIQTDEDIKALYEMIEQQSEQFKDLNEKNSALSAQIEFQVELNNEKKEMEQRLNEHVNRIESLMKERTQLIEELEKNISLSIQTTSNEVQTDDDEHEQILAVNNKLKHVLQGFKDKVHRLVAVRPDLFDGIGEETSERLDTLISTVEQQATEIVELHFERDQLDEKYQRELGDIQNSFDMYRQQIDNEYRNKLNEHISSHSPITHEIETQTIDLQEVENQISQTTVSDLNESNDWFDASPELTDHHQSRDVENQCELEHTGLSSNNDSTQTDIDSFSFEDLQKLKDKIHEISLLSSPNENTFEDLDQILSTIKDLQNEIRDLQSSFDAYRTEIENERLIKMEQSNHVCTQTLGLSMSEQYQKQIEKLQENEIFYQRKIERLIEERDQAQDLLSQWKEENKTVDDQELYERLQEQDNSSPRSLNNIESPTNLDVDSSSLSDSRTSDYQSQIDDLLRERIILMEQIKQLTSQPSKSDIESQKINNINLLSSSSDQGISRHIFEQELLAWSKESEELKRLVKQIQIENKKLKDIILKFERMVLDYVHENERLRQENQHLSFNNYSTIQKVHETENVTSSDKDICYLTLKWLTYEVDQRTSNNNNNTYNNNEQSILFANDIEYDFKQRYNDAERQMKNICLQNERLKNQLETYTIQFNHLQHEMSMKIQEISALKDETERLRVNEIQYRSEAGRLKSELQDDQLKIQQLEHDLLDIKLQQSSNDADSIDNLRELLELKERELNALKEKLDYTKQAHKIELQEANKANQFSLENAKRHEQMESRYKEKQQDLEARIEKFCTIIRPLINNQHLSTQNPITNIDELQKLIAEADAEKQVTNTLSPIRDCLSLLEAQMKDLHHSIIENHARRSKRWKYKLGFECLSCESRWEVTHDVRDLEIACLDPKRFLESSIVEPMAGCSCPIMIDFGQNDVRLCVDDMINEVITGTTVK